MFPEALSLRQFISSSAMRLLVFAIGTGLATIGPVYAGSITLAWGKVDDPELQGYRLYYGLRSRQYDRSIDLPPETTRHTLTGLDDCTFWYLALKSLDGEGQASAAFSPEVAGYPRPEATTVAPDLALLGGSQTVRVTGMSFEPGARLEALDAGVTVANTVVESCQTMTATLSVTSGTVGGMVNLRAVNPGGVPSLSTVSLAIVGDPGPTVVTSEPPDGARGILPGARPKVVFDRELVPESVHGGVALILDESGAPVPQAAGSPVASGDMIEIIPAVALRQKGIFRIHIVGGSAGVRDRNGVPAVFGLMQTTGFQIADLPPEDVSGVHRTDTKENP